MGITIPGTTDPDSHLAWALAGEATTTTIHFIMASMTRGITPPSTILCTGTDIMAGTDSGTEGSMVAITTIIQERCITLVARMGRAEALQVEGATLLNLHGEAPEML